MFYLIFKLPQNDDVNQKQIKPDQYINNKPVSLLDLLICVLKEVLQLIANLNFLIPKS